MLYSFNDWANSIGLERPLGGGVGHTIAAALCPRRQGQSLMARLEEQLDPSFRTSRRQFP
jgi:hypothetical protein